MVNIDIMALANDFILEENQPLVVRLEIAKGILAAAVEYVNSRSKSERETIFENVVDFGEMKYKMVLPDKVFDSYVEKVRAIIRNAAWDTRLVIKLQTKEVGVGYFTATLAMDLEATAERLGWDTTPAPAEKESVTEKITDTPSMDEINEFDKLNGARSLLQSPLSPNRRAEFVRKDTRVRIATYSRHDTPKAVE